ncbi:hypothetical protein G6F54_013742 [Rhizopus delemar]|nr:hypothetical protein G6F54_013742 [Rhizopus delemar]
MRAWVGANLGWHGSADQGRPLPERVGADQGRMLPGCALLVGANLGWHRSADQGRPLPGHVRTWARTHPTGYYWASFAFSAEISLTGASSVAGRQRGSTAEMPRRTSPAAARGWRWSRLPRLPALYRPWRTLHPCRRRW